MRPLDDATLRVLYRGRLSSCNYDCAYCPFAKRRDSRETLARDADDLSRFVEWAAAAPEPLAILFTPWGEGLVRKPYIDALVRLSHAPNVRRVAIQTNLSSNLKWLARANPDSLALWCTYHPSQVSRAVFVTRLARVREAGVRFSVGVVGAREHYDEIDALRVALRDDEYLWINALDPRPADYYAADDVARLAAIDPHFPFNLDPPPSLGADCRAGATAISVDGDGNVRPCHFVQRDLGNLYDGSFAQRRGATPCPNARCDCFIGYAHRRDVGVSAAFGNGLMERVLPLPVIPAQAGIQLFGVYEDLTLQAGSRPAPG